MKDFNLFKKKENAEAGNAAEKVVSNAIATKGGSYSVIMGVVLLAILIVINLIVSVLPATWTSYDISAVKLYSLTSNTKAVVNELDEDVTIYWIVQANQENVVLENLLAKYEATNSHVTVVKKNPDVYPTFAEQYTSEDVQNNSLVVVCGDKSRYIGYDQIYLEEIDYSTYTYASSFDGEGQITSAINYVTSDTFPKVYTLEGHGEEALSSTFESQIQKMNYELDSLSLLKESSVPEDASCIIVNAPSSDISDKELKILKEYVANGGKLLLFVGLTEDGTLENFASILGDYGLEVCDGVVIEGDSNYYGFEEPYILIPELQSTEATDPLIEEGYLVLMPISQGIDISNANSNVTPLLLTSELAYSKKAGYAISTYDIESGDIEGQFALGVSIAVDEGQIIWYSSAYLLDDTYNSYSSGANINLASNSLKVLVGDNSTVSISSKSLDYNYLTISESQSKVLEIVLIIVIPVIFVLIGIIVLVSRRRRRKHE